MAYGRVKGVVVTRLIQYYYERTSDRIMYGDDNVVIATRRPKRKLPDLCPSWAIFTFKIYLNNAYVHFH